MTIDQLKLLTYRQLASMLVKKLPAFWSLADYVLDEAAGPEDVFGGKFWDDAKKRSFFATWFTGIRIDHVVENGTTFHLYKRHGGVKWLPKETLDTFSRLATLFNCQLKILPTARHEDLIEHVMFTDLDLAVTPKVVVSYLSILHFVTGMTDDLKQVEPTTNIVRMKTGIDKRWLMDRL